MAKRRTIVGLPDQAEAAMDDVIQKSVAHIEYMLEVLMPDGRPFGVDPKPIDEQLNEYVMGGFQTDPEACKQKIRMLVGQINTTLMGFGVSPEEAAQVHPYAIAEAAALQWSAQMEKLLAEKAAEASYGIN